MIQWQILQTNIMRIVWQTVRRITNEILGVKGLTLLLPSSKHQSFFLSFILFSWFLFGKLDVKSSKILWMIFFLFIITVLLKKASILQGRRNSPLVTRELKGQYMSSSLNYWIRQWWGWSGEIFLRLVSCLFYQSIFAIKF